MKKIILTLLLITIVVILLSSLLLVSLCVGYKVHRDVSYGTLENETMDIYIPKEAYGRSSNGCVLFIHGGSWSGGDKREEELRCRYVASHGYIAATMNYSLYSDDTKDEYSANTVLNEIDMALERIKSFTEEMNIKVTMAATSGYSAGAHLSMLYSYSRTNTAPLEIKFTSNMAGPADINPDIWGTDLAKGIGEILSEKDITNDMIESGEADEILDAVSPVTYINSNTPPSIFMYGGKDTTVPIGNWESLKHKLDTVGVEYDFVFLPNATHSLINNPLKRLSYPKLLLSYCDEYFD